MIYATFPDMIERTTQNIVDDLERLTFNNPEISKALDFCYKNYMVDGKPYRELFASKLFGTIKYMMTVTPGISDPTSREITVTDLDTNKIYVI